MPKISVIVAVYSAEKYIRHCLDSILAQQFKDYEVILVDDGSTDQSGFICDDYAKKDSRIRVEHKKNGGVASARELGLELARGKYVIHVDPDDWIEPEMLGEMYEFAEKETADMVICDFIKHYKDLSTYVCQKPNSLSNKEIVNDFFGELGGYCWNKLIRRECFLSYNIHFVPSMIVWEDLYLCLNLVMNPIRITYLPKAFYHYIRSVNENSLVNTVSRRKLESMLTFVQYFNKQNKDFDLSLLEKKKIEAKRCAFLISDMKKSEFISIFPETNHLFVEGFDGYRKIDELIQFALKKSWILSRLILKLWKIKFKYRGE